VAIRPLVSHRPAQCRVTVATAPSSAQGFLFNQKTKGLSRPVRSSVSPFLMLRFVSVTLLGG
jgi:hypothetical protein